jgi:HNH endonuclease
MERYSTLKDKLLNNYVEVNGPLHSPCWIWTLSLDGRGYGQLWWGGQKMQAHRASWIEHNGPIPDGLCVCHHCDNRSCIRPGHLFLGTHADNTYDMIAKGRADLSRGYLGETHPKAKLTERQAAEVKWLLANTSWPQTRIGEKYGVGRNVINDISNRRSWTHVTTMVKPELQTIDRDPRF